jgi:hypothetical protein
MIEMAKPIIRPVDRSPHKRRDVRRAQESMSRDVPNDLDVVVGYAEGWSVGSPVVSWSARYVSGQCAIAHGFILAVGAHTPDDPLEEY